MEIPAKCPNPGYVKTGLDSTTPHYVDLSAFVGGYVKVFGDADFWANFGPEDSFGFDLTDTSEVFADNRPDQVASGPAGWQRLVDADNPWLVVRGVTSADWTVRIKGASDPNVTK